LKSDAYAVRWLLLYADVNQNGMLLELVALARQMVSQVL
jgi:hypothetical protein